MEHTAKRIDLEIEERRELAVERFLNSPYGKELDENRDKAEDMLRAKFDKKDHVFVEDLIDSITAYYQELAIYLYHDAYGDFLTLPAKR